jgi:exopolyphosphatase / guanosine-5'-triphosphate,3'-diphosphate pyrophosphatase
VTAQRVAAIDCGTNSIRLLVADIDPASGTLRDVDRRMEIVRLGEDVDRTGMLSGAALERTFAACERYAAAITRHRAERVRFVATSASRDAGNRDVFVSGVLELIGVEPEVVTGEDEAALSFGGATRELVGRAPGPYLVVDIGGGSTEFVLGSEGPVAARSLDLGCVRLTERYLRTDPPTPAEIAVARAEAGRLVEIAAVDVPMAQARTLVGVAGTVTTLAAIALGLTGYDAEATHLSVLPMSEVHALSAQLLAMTRAERAAIPVMHPGRADVIGGGALVLEAVVDQVTTLTGIDQLVVSEHDILDGIAWSQVW